MICLKCQQDKDPAEFGPRTQACFKCRFLAIADSQRKHQRGTKGRGYKKEKYLKNRLQVIERVKKYKQEHPEKVRQYNKTWLDKQTEEITDQYILKCLNVKATVKFKITDLTPEFFELYRKNLRLKRMAKHGY